MLDRLTAPRRLTRDRAGHPVVDEAAPGHDGGANTYETRGTAFCELLEHLPTHGWTRHGSNTCEVLVTIDLDTLLPDSGRPLWTVGSRSPPARPAAWPAAPA